MRAAISIVLLATLVAPFSTATAQDPLQAEVGDRVRIWYMCTPTCRRTAGTITAFGSDSIVVRTPDARDLQISRDAVARLESSAGQGRRTVRGLGIGALAGAVIGIIPAAAYDPQPTASYDLTSVAIYAAAIVGGAVAGAIVGSAMRGEERWQEVPLDRLGMSFAPQRLGRFALGWSVRF